MNNQDIIPLVNVNSDAFKYYNWAILYYPDILYEYYTFMVNVSMFIQISYKF